MPERERLPHLPKKCFRCDHWRSINEEEQKGNCIARSEITPRNFCCYHFLPAEVPF